MLLFLGATIFREQVQRLRQRGFFGRSRSLSSRSPSRPIKICLLIDEYFGGWGTAYGGYGFLARRLVAKHLPQEDLQVEVILHGLKVDGPVQKQVIDGITVYKLSSSDRLSRYWLAIKRFDLFLSIELTSIAAIKLAPKATPHILWIQDPRPHREWDEIATVKLFPEPSYYDQRIYDFVAERQEHIRFVSQGIFLNDLAKELYQLRDGIQIDYLPNPIELPPETGGSLPEKENMVVFLGRIDSVKRGWIFCELAKTLPQYQFYVLGAIHNNVQRNKEVLEPYIDANGCSRIPNLHFVGHVDGQRKQEYLHRAKVLVNTSIHEALPVSFLEALAAKTLIVSCRNPEGLTERFGYYTGTVLGDGFDRVQDFALGIEKILGDEVYRRRLAEEGYQYLRHVHSIDRFQMAMRKVIDEEVGKLDGRRVQNTPNRLGA